MNISFLLPHVRLYGGIRRVLEIANKLVDMGIRVTIYHSDGSDCTWMPVKARMCPASDFIRDNHDHAVYVFHEQYELFHQATAHHRYFYCLNLYNKRTLSLPLGLQYFIDRRAYWIRKSVLHPMVRVLVNCTDSALWLNANLGVQSLPILGAVDHSIFYPNVDRRQHDHRVILCLGSLKPWKGTDIIRDAVQRVQKQDPRVQLRAFADDGTPVNQLGDVYRSASMLVDAQSYAGWNNPIAEAMACKIPVICYDIGPNRDLAIHEKTALLVAVGDVDAMVRSIRRLLNDQTLVSRLTEEAYRRVLPYTWERTTRELLSVFKAEK